MPHNDDAGAAEKMADALARTLAEALDTMAFIAVEPADATSCAPFPQAPADAVLAEMDFTKINGTGPTSGRVRLVASRRFSMTLAGNVLGLTPNDPDAAVRADDCFKELLNVVVGALMPHLAETPADDFRLSIPRARALPTAEWPAFCAGPTVRLVLAEGQTLAARLDAA